ncbi:MAG: molybdate ABC transporter substrate-binding protein [Desulfuromonadales bacterium]|nr:molybdate ABC transporter substrate-binding protein [Desulfuromonadales bacterium]
MTYFKLLILACSLILTTTAHAEKIMVAVAANFAAPMKALAADFEKESGHKVVLSFGSSGKFYSQITNGAPFQLFLSAYEE